MQHVTIYRETGRFAGWPANYGIWNWHHEIVVGFTVGYIAPKQPDSIHNRDKTRPFVNMQARSLDGGLSWHIESFPGKTPGNRGLSANEHMQPVSAGSDTAMSIHAPGDPPGGIDFANPGFALMCARTGLGAGAESFFYTSEDRCQSWQGPYQLPLFGQGGVAARTDYIVEGSHQCLLLLTASKRNGREGRVFCVRTRDGARSFEFVSFVGDEPIAENAFAIMPASLQLPDGRILCAIRCRDADSAWIDIYSSEDAARTWHQMTPPVRFTRPIGGGNPPTLNQLPDGRLVMVYGRRDGPLAIAARLSADNGQSWSEEYVLRHGAGSPDLGYPRTVVLADGRVLTVYYFNDRADGNGERYIESTIWQPPDSDTIP